MALLSKEDLGQAPVLVLHRMPDLDAVSAAWLARRVLRDGRLPNSECALGLLIGAVGAHDQGHSPAGPPESDWATVAAMSIALERGDRQRLVLGLELMERTYGILSDGGTLREASQRVVRERAVVALREARERYLEDRAAGQRFRLRLLGTEPGEPRDLWGLALRAPRSALFKQLARTDPEAPGGAGWAALVVSRPVTGRQGSPPLWRHVISVAPESGLQLAGLGSHLDGLERGRWEEPEGLPAWYDGAGHGFTIVDSPALKVGGRDVLASRLDPETVVQALRAGAWIRPL